MPIAFFTRTHTGALVSRLNNDVIGAQRAFTSALSGVVTNVIALVLTVVVMLSLSWQITVLALVLLPVFVIPARRVGAKVGALEREATEHNAAMTSQMTERFSAPGRDAGQAVRATRPTRRTSSPSGRKRVNDIGVRSAMAMEVFLRALTLVSGLAQALIYGLGGYLALQGELDPGTVVTMALLLNRLYAPLTALATARLDIVTALVSFERVFEVLDIEPMIVERPDAAAVPDGPVTVEFDDVHFGYPSAAAGVTRIAGGGRRARRPCRRGGAARRVLPGRGRPDGRPRRVVRRRQVDARLARAPALRRRAQARCGCPGATCATSRSTRSGRPSAWSPRTATCSTTRSGPTCATPLRTRPTTSCGRRSTSARLGDLVRSLPDGLDTVVGERGYRLSGGERQRLTIARLLLAGPRVVILDEATAHLDSQSEVAVQEALAAALDGRTALVIAHRLSTIRAADAILVIDDGRVVERGTHAELLAAGGRYADLYETQFADGFAAAAGR